MIVSSIFSITSLNSSPHILTLFLLVVLTETNLPVVTLSRFESLFDSLFLIVTLFFGGESSKIGELDSDELDKCKKKSAALDEPLATGFFGFIMIGSNIEAPIAETPTDCASTTSSATDAFCMKSLDSFLESTDESTISIIESMAAELSSFCVEAKLVCKF